MHAVVNKGNFVCGFNGNNSYCSFTNNSCLVSPFPKPPLRNGVLICCASVDRVDCIVNTEVVFTTRFSDGTWKKCFTAFTWRVVRVHVTMKPSTLVKVRGTVVTTIASDVYIFMLLASYGPLVHYINLK